MDDVRLAAALSAAAETERAVRFHLDHTESPAELARGWVAYRNAVGLRKALETWVETRAYRVAHVDVDSAVVGR